MRRLIGVFIVLLILLAVIGGLFLVDYRAGIALMIGLGVAAVFGAYVRGAPEGRRGRRIVVALGALVVVGGVAAVVVFGPNLLPAVQSPIAEEPSVEVEAESLPAGAMPRPGGIDSGVEGQGADDDAQAPADPPVIDIESVFVVVTPNDDNLTAFTVASEVEVVITQSGSELLRRPQVLPSYTVNDESLGFLVRQVSLGSLDIEVPLEIRETELRVPVCDPACPPTTVELREFPAGAFYEARHSDNVVIEEFVNVETVTWQMTRLDRPVVFAFVRPPFNAVSGALTPVLGAATVNDWVVGVAGLVGGVVFMPLIRAFLEDWVEGQVFDTVRGSDRDNRRSRRRKR